MIEYKYEETRARSLQERGVSEWQDQAWNDARPFYCTMYEAHYVLGAPKCDEQCRSCASPPYFATYHDGRPAPNRRPDPDG